MSFWSQSTAAETSAIDPTGFQPARPRGPGFAQSVAEGFAYVNYTGGMESRNRLYGEEIDPIIAALNDGIEYRDRLVHPYQPNSSLGGPPGAGGSTPITQEMRDRWEDELWDTLAFRRAEDPESFNHLPAGREEVTARVNQRVRDLERSFHLSRDIGGNIGQFVGQMGGYVVQPEVAITLPFGGSGSLWRVAVTLGTLSAASEAAALPTVARIRNEAGLDFTWEDGASRVAFAGTGGAVVGTGFVAISRAISGRLRTPRDGAETLDAAQRGRDPTDQEVSNTSRVLRAAEESEANPHGGPQAGRVHEENIQEAQRALFEGTDPRFRETGIIRSDIDALGGNLVSLRPDRILVDAEAYQFKSGGDGAGVTARLQGVEEWSPESAGIILVHERFDGRFFIADGHQRLALANRLAAEGRDVMLMARLLRESDGISIQDARAIAALKNLREGSGDLVDAAQVLRDAPERFRAEEGSLPVTDGKIRDARYLAQLGDDPWGAVKNGVVAPHYGALIGRLVPDPDHQMAVIRELSKAVPDNLVQAEAVIRAVREAGFVDETQLTLFGQELVAHSLYGERARVLDRSIRELRKDRSLANALIENRGRIEAQGNRVATEQTLSWGETAAIAETMLMRLANRRGGLSDGLTDAARMYKADGGYRRAVPHFLDSVRDAARRGDFAGDGIAPPRDARANQSAATSAADPDAALSAKVDPNRIELDPDNPAAAFDELEQRHRSGDFAAYVSLPPVSDDMAARVLRDTGIDIQGYRRDIKGNAWAHIRKHHGNPIGEAARGQQAITPEDIIATLSRAERADSIATVNTKITGQRGLEFRTKLEDGTSVHVELVRRRNQVLSVHTIWRSKRGGEVAPEQAGRPTSETTPTIPPRDGPAGADPSREGMSSTGEAASELPIVPARADDATRLAPIDGDDIGEMATRASASAADDMDRARPVVDPVTGETRPAGELLLRADQDEDLAADLSACLLGRTVS